MNTVIFRYVLAVKLEVKGKSGYIHFLWFSDHFVDMPLIFDSIDEARFLDTEREAIALRKKIEELNPERYKNKIHILKVACDVKVVGFPKEIAAFIDQS